MGHSGSKTRQTYSNSSFKMDQSDFEGHFEFFTRVSKLHRINVIFFISHVLNCHMNCFLTKYQWIKNYIPIWPKNLTQLTALPQWLNFAWQWALWIIAISLFKISYYRLWLSCLLRTRSNIIFASCSLECNS